MSIRLSKLVISLAMAVFTLAVTVNNVVDYNTNFAFVEHVLSMDTIFPSSTLRSRAISDQHLWHASYVLIIAWEGMTTLLLWLGVIALFRARHSPAAIFNERKRLLTIGCTAGYLLWFLGFLVVGGEWFMMWQSRSWNGQDNAFKFSIALLVTLLFVNQPDGEIERS